MKVQSHVEMHLDNVMDNDPLSIKKYDSPYYKTFYNIYVVIPPFLGFSIVFFLIFFMSPQG